ncbi:bifunctional metallophosphatase/5'-nucleotidase [Salegentibacter flavus]|uniref:2',3'-cyclic-nucleotide 2'-phosphodiesterase/5'-or 3'-nucleotidase, 5'-nucleotidase family n=1 Tax=Salegentibacter flavus TaxID=287099 RepID=A0A1I5BBB8_9FLAO|nr:5'-nucleotidase C-terminal domain-containing protein [Salegentibacter flavus]SFN72004.1 2',3'-cyclic-nucleotide 2'-phosphodiesterase/5'-or 3'-nucleotidase, 5'-nucleotidase family [Salegentibacter flavus]
MENLKEFSLIQITDVHGYMESHQEMFWEKGQKLYRKAGGYTRISQYLKKIREEKQGAVIALDGGDTFHGTYPVVQTKGEILVSILNHLGLDAMTAHWDFAYGPERFKEITAELNYPMLAINVYDKETNELLYKPWIIKEIEGIKVAVIGIASNIVDKTMPAHFSKGIYFTLGNEELPKHIQTLKEQEKADVIVLISHLGFPQNLKLMKEVEGVDICLSSHTHYRTESMVKVGNTIMIESGCHGSFLGRLDVTLQDKKIKDVNFELVEVTLEFPEDQELKKQIENALLPYREYLNKKAGETTKALDRNNILESSMDNLLLQAMLMATGSQLAFSNGWRYGAPIVPGSITNNDLHNIIPVNPVIETVILTGREILDMLEENLEKTFSGDAYKQQGGFVKRCLGLKAYIKIEVGTATRIQKLFIGEEPINPEENYTACYVTSQGVPGKYGKERAKSGIRAVDALQKYLNTKSPVSAEIFGTFEAV